MSEQRWTYLLERCIQDTLSPDEQAELMRMAALPGNEERMMRFLDALLASQEKQTIPVGEDVSAAILEAVFYTDTLQIVAPGQQDIAVNDATTMPRLHRSRRWQVMPWLAAAAVLLLAVCDYWLFNQPPKQGKTLAASRGERKTEHLPDGTAVVLNSGSTIVLGKDFNGHSRDVTLSGEAYFNVTANAQKPFTVHTARMDIKVLGTAFNVHAYTGEPTEVASLVTGKIAVTIKEGSGSNIITMLPMQKITIGSKAAVQGQPHIDSIVPDKQLAVPAETAWLSNKLIFSGETLSGVAATLEKWFDVTIRIDKDALKNIPYTGSFDKPDLKNILATLQFTIPDLHYRFITNKQIILY